MFRILRIIPLLLCLPVLLFPDRLEAKTPAPTGNTCTGRNLLPELTAEERARLETAAARHPYHEGNYWRAEKNGNVIHVIGTIHLPDPRLEERVDRLWPLVSGVDEILLEATPDTIRRLKEAMARDPGFLFIQQGPTLLEQMEENEWQALSRALAARGIPPIMAAKLQPWFAMTLLSIPPCMQTPGGMPPEGVDALIMQRAEAEGLAMRELEPFDTLFRLMNKGTPEENLKQLRLALVTMGNPRKSEDALATMMALYLAGRHRMIIEISYHMALAEGIAPEDLNAMKESMEVDLLAGRNLNWMDVILPAAEEREIAVVVGAGHLSGDTGILRLLENAGYELVRQPRF